MCSVYIIAQQSARVITFFSRVTVRVCHIGKQHSRRVQGQEKGELGAGYVSSRQQVKILAGSTAIDATAWRRPDSTPVGCHFVLEDAYASGAVKRPIKTSANF